VLCCGDLFIFASPNAGNPQKVQRYPREWAQALRRMLTLDAEYLLPGHGPAGHGFGPGRPGARPGPPSCCESSLEQTLEIMTTRGASTKPSTVSSPFPPRRAVVSAADLRRARVHRATTSGASHGGWWDGKPRHLEAGSRGGPWPARWRPSPAGLAPWRHEPSRLLNQPAPDRCGTRHPKGHSAWRGTWRRWRGWRIERPGHRGRPPAGVHHARRARDLDHGQRGVQLAARTSSPED